MGLEDGDSVVNTAKSTGIPRLGTLETYFFDWSKRNNAKTILDESQILMAMTKIHFRALL